MKKSPMTTAELFERVCGILKEKGRMPEILDYALADHSPAPILDYQYDLKSNLAYGGCEGIYLDLWIEYCRDGKKRISGLGVFKTLRTDNEAMHIMSGLLADFIVEESVYVNANLDDFTWLGAEVHPLDGTGKILSWGYSCRTMERALAKKEELLKKYPKVIVRNNETREKKVYSRKAQDREKSSVSA